MVNVDLVMQEIAVEMIDYKQEGNPYEVILRLGEEGC